MIATYSFKTIYRQYGLPSLAKKAVGKKWINRRKIQKRTY